MPLFPTYAHAQAEPATSLRAQDAAAFSWVDFSASALLPVAAGGLEGWTANRAAGLDVQTPFYRGRVSLGVNAQSWLANDRSGLPDFVGLFLYAGWRGGSPADEPVRISGGIRLGNYFMAFDSDEEAGNRNESELAIAPEIEFRIRLSERFDVYASSSTMRVFTEPRQTILDVGIGLSFRFAAPPELRTVLE